MQGAADHIPVMEASEMITGVSLRDVPAVQPTLSDLCRRWRDAEQDIIDTMAEGRFPSPALRRRWKDARDAYTKACDAYSAAQLWDVCSTAAWAA